MCVTFLLYHWTIKSFWFYNEPNRRFWYATVLTVCSYHITYAFQSESTLYGCLNVKELLAQNRREIWRLSECNWTRTHNHLLRKRTLNRLAKLASLGKWLSVCLRTKWLCVRFQLLQSCWNLNFWLPLEN